MSKRNREAVAQLVERLLCTQDVAGSIPVASILLHSLKSKILIGDCKFDRC